MDKAHVEHAVRFVEHQTVQAVQLQRAPAEMILDPARRTDNDVCALFK